jgi:hypothetical protein
MRTVTRVPRRYQASNDSPASNRNAGHIQEPSNAGSSVHAPAMPSNAMSAMNR